jgi:hypothetical protein
VPSIRLKVASEDQPKTPYRYHDPVAGVVGIPVLRLTAIVRAHSRQPGGQPYRFPLPALVDTGAWISIVEYDTWAAWADAGCVEVLSFPDGKARRSGIGGTGFEYTFGRVNLSAVELSGWPRTAGVPAELALPPVPVLFQLIHKKKDKDKDKDKYLPKGYTILLGLHHGILDGRRLRREVVASKPLALSTDCGPHFAQEWFLETP